MRKLPLASPLASGLHSTLSPLLLITALFSAPALQAADDSQAIELQPIFVTAARSAPEIEPLVASTVIDRGDIERSGAIDLLQVLNTEAGIDVFQNGGPGQTSSVFLRGTNSDQVLVLIDGVRANEAGSGGFGWETLPLAQIERIEIVRGPRSTLYGADAVGGVIQIFTRANSNVFELELGSYDHIRALAGLGQQFGNAKLSLSAQHRESDGFSASNERSGEFTFAPDDDGYSEDSINLRLAYAGERYDLAFKSLYVDSDGDFDNGEFGPGKFDSESLNLGVDGSFDLSEHMLLKAQLGLNNQLRDSDGFRAENDRFVASLQTEFDLSALAAFDTAQFIVGMDYYDDDFNSSFNGAPSTVGSIDNQALFAYFTMQRGKLVNELGLRLDDHSRFGNETTGSAALGWVFNPAWSAFVSYGQAFNAPDVFDLFSAFGGNADLQPETSATAEVRLEYQPAAEWYVGLSVYDTEIDQLIADPDGFGPEPLSNIDEASIQGAELTARWQPKHWRLHSSLTFLQAEDGQGQALLRRSDRKFTAGAARLWQSSELALEAVAYSDAPDVGGRRAGYLVVNLAAKHRINAANSLSLRIDNLLDHEYEPSYGYNASDIAFYIGYRFTPNN